MSENYLLTAKKLFINTCASSKKCLFALPLKKTRKIFITLENKHENIL